MPSGHAQGELCIVFDIIVRLGCTHCGANGKRLGIKVMEEIA
jgi:hypothetical protein